MVLLDSPLKFDETGHRYYLNGTPVPSVTRVLEYTGLVNYGFLGERRDEYLERGRIVHLATRNDDEGGLAQSSVPVELRGYLQAWRAFRSDYAFVPILIEHRVFHAEHGFAGTLDRTGRIGDGTEIILDIKSGLAPAAVGLQLAAYASCLAHPRARRRRCVELHQDGTYKVIPHETSDYQRDLNTFLEALTAYKARRGQE